MKTLCLAAAAVLAVVSPVAAQQAGELTVGLGIANVNPKSDNGTLAGGAVPVSIDDNTRPQITVEYFIRDNIGVELPGALPFKHSIRSNGTEIGTVKHLPPVVSLQYHFDATPQWKPFVGVGVNFTGFFDAEAKGPLAGNDLRVKNSWGLAAHLGTDYWINDRSAVRATPH